MANFHLSKIMWVLALSFCVLWSCKNEIVEEPFNPTENHNQYLTGLEKMGLLESALGRDWKNASTTALDNPLSVNLPFKEVFYLNKALPSSMGYRFSLKKGEKIEITVDRLSESKMELFMDVFRLKGENMELMHIASKSQNHNLIEFEVREDAQYILRIQPELLRGGNFLLDIRSAPSLEFPVSGKTKTAILSLFGDPRDAGRRKHHGVDIFAKRHTPVVAPNDGLVRYSGEKGLGGKQVWLYDKKRDQSLYFAHLEDVFVSRGEKVMAGDTLGTVGNSGNAKTTAPHLHFGIYHSGPHDPYPYIVDNGMKAKKIWGSKDNLGKWMRTSRSVQFLNPANGTKTELIRNQMVHLIAASSYSYRVCLPDGRMGYIPYTDLEDIVKPLQIEELAMPAEMKEGPDIVSSDIKVLDAGEPLEIHGVHDNYWYVTDNSGRKGWITAP